MLKKGGTLEYHYRGLPGRGLGQQQAELFDRLNQIPPTGLSTQKEQAIDPLEGFRRKEEGEEEAQSTMIKTIRYHCVSGYIDDNEGVYRIGDELDVLGPVLFIEELK